MTLQELVALSPEEQKAWLDSEDHRYNCAAWSEGQWCCLEKMLGLTDPSIRSVFKDGLAS